MNAETLAQVLRPIKNVFDPDDHPDLLIGLDGPDDAAVWKVKDDLAIVVTTDFFTPVVDTAYEYGAIAAANSLSDVFAMGGRPFLALNISAFPPQVPTEILSGILLGGAEKCKEAGVVVAGGHTIQDKEPKFGLVVLGFVDPNKVITKSGAKAGDQLYLTKPLGIGTTTTALKRGLLTIEETDEVIRWMSTLNANAGKLAAEHSVRGGTDITGFGFLGHASEVANASGVKFVITFGKIPFLSKAKQLAEEHIFPGGSYDNKLYFGEKTSFVEEISEAEQMLLFDAQTSGGLLLSVPRELSDQFELKAKEINTPVWKIGEVVPGNGIEIIK